MKVDLYNKIGKKTSKKITLNKSVFCIKPNKDTIYLAIKSELAANRQGTASSKNRSAVRGGGAKPWKQKGTGRSRVGSLRNPSRVHGGVAFGPEPRKYNLKVNKKVKNLARRSALSIKINSKNFIILDDLNLNSHKTKDLFEMLNSLNIIDKKVVILTYGDSSNSIYLGSKNLKNVNSKNVSYFSTYDIMNSNFLLTDKSAIDYLNEKLI